MDPPYVVCWTLGPMMALVYGSVSAEAGHLVDVEPVE